MLRPDETTARALIHEDLDRTQGDADFLSALAELRAPVRERAPRARRLSLRAECLRVLRRPQRSRQAIVWIGWIEAEHVRWRLAHPMAPPRPGPELLELPAVPSLPRSRNWAEADVDAVLRYVDAMSRRRAALVNFIQARLHEYRGIPPEGWVGPDQLP
jgi:hypothetical protein